ncbi:hypothetical protein BN1723_013931 [Verticillium longisporum]|uniref:Uncharacterized protein n=1 Tax=Verticillium longisporum TaxID=100787 RepID=A0A0G4LYP8_VERLO|nr:hypothetical protein BN1708_013169 [Verticillium longisporum]CRK27132.1 hypothetical protein BN1723_013931 [Verticillium longisporum]
MSSILPPAPQLPGMAPGATTIRVGPLYYLSTTFAQFNAEPISDRASVAAVTRKQRQNIFQKWQIYFRNVLGMDPDDIWLQLCDESFKAIEYCQAFLQDYVVYSVEQRIALGPQEYDDVRTVTCTKTVLEAWKGLAKRRSDPRNARHWTLAVKERSTGPVSKISLALTDNAFSGEYRSAFEILSVLKLQGLRSIPLSWKNSMLERPIFEISPQKFSQI